MVTTLTLGKKTVCPEKARDIFEDLKWDHKCFYGGKDAIGKCYRRMDATGSPFYITIDHQTIENNTVTICERDNMEQERISIEQLKQVVVEKAYLKKGHANSRIDLVDSDNINNY